MKIGLYGELPAKTCVMAACDSSYLLEHGLAFVKSASDNNKDIHLHVINPTDEALAFSCVLQGIAETTLTFTYNDFKFTDKWSNDNKKSLYACLRFLIAPTILKSIQNSGSLTILDIDSIIMSDFKIPATKIIGYFPREPLPGTVGWEREGTKVAAGAIYYRKESRSLEVAERVAREIETMPMQWFVDQIALNKVFTVVAEQEPNIFHKFDSDFMDWEFVEGTSIWTGKGPRKYDNKTYVSKKKSYDAVLEELKGFSTVVLEPRLDIMMKRGLEKARGHMSDPQIRKYWKKYSEKLQKDDTNNLVITSPRWMFKSEILQWFGGDAKVYVPHVEKSTWGGDDRCSFYMQTVFPWLFTQDPEGWAGGAKYIESFDPSAEYTDEVFNEFSEYSKSGGSKYDQPKNDAPMVRGKTAGVPFIFVPMQIPNDMTLKYHSDVGVWDMVNKLADWAENTPEAPHVVFKFHPGMGSSDAEATKFMTKIDNYEKVGLRTGQEISIHKLFAECDAVYVNNSGTGQEAMLWDLPVVTFGRADYNPAVIGGKINDLDFTWQSVQVDDHDKRKETYRKWYDWYVNDVCVDLKRE